MRHMDVIDKITKLKEEVLSSSFNNIDTTAFLATDENSVFFKTRLLGEYREVKLISNKSSFYIAIDDDYYLAAIKVISDGIERKYVLGNNLTIAKNIIELWSKNVINTINNIFNHILSNLDDDSVQEFSINSSNASFARTIRNLTSETSERDSHLSARMDNDKIIFTIYCGAKTVEFSYSIYKLKLKNVVDVVLKAEIIYDSII